MDNKKQTYDLLVRKLAGKYYVSQDGKSWKKTPGMSLTKSLLAINEHFLLFRGFKPSGLGGAGAGELITQMPGKVVRIMVEEGAEVKEGDTLFILEAMKMENEMKASVDGVVKNIYVKENQVIDAGVLMAEIERD